MVISKNTPVVKGLSGWVSLAELVERCTAETAAVASALAVLKPATRFFERPIDVVWNFHASVTATRFAAIKELGPSGRIDRAFAQPIDVPMSEVLRVMLIGPHDWHGAFTAASEAPPRHLGRRVVETKYPRG